MNLWSCFAFENEYGMHCTHKFFGASASPGAISVVIDKYFNLHPFLSFTVLFDKEETFANNTRVFTCRDDLTLFKPRLRQLLNPFRNDDYLYVPHVACKDPTVKSVEARFTRYALMHGKTEIAVWRARR